MISNPLRFLWSQIQSLRWDASIESIHYAIVFNVDTKKNTMDVYLNGRENTPKKNITININGSYSAGLRIMPTINTIVILLRTTQGFVHIGSFIPGHENFLIDLQDTIENNNKKLAILPELKEGESYLWSINRNYIWIKNNGEITLQSNSSATMTLFMYTQRLYQKFKHYIKETLKSYEYFGQVTKLNSKNYWYYPKLDYDEYRMVLQKQTVGVDPIYEKHIAQAVTEDDDTGITPKTNSKGENIVYYEQINNPLTSKKVKVTVSTEGTVEIDIIGNKIIYDVDGISVEDINKNKASLIKDGISVEDVNKNKINTTSSGIKIEDKNGNTIETDSSKVSINGANLTIAKG